MSVDVVTRPSVAYQALKLALDDRHDVHFNSFLHAEGNHLFNERAFFELHASSPHDFYAQLTRRSDQAVCATIACYESDNRTFTSPKRGTFGGVGLNRPLDRCTVERFLVAILNHVTHMGGRVLELKCPPMSHDLALASVVSNVLLRHGGTLSGCDLNYDIRVDSRSFEERIEYSSLKRIRKCVRDGFVASELDSSRFDEAYQVISENRARRSFPMSMTAEQLQVMLDRFPGRLHYFAAHPDPQRLRIIAAAICLRLTPSILYVFYWGDAAGMQQYSPITLLASRIYDFCQHHGFTTLDAGTSTVGGEPNDGLIRFKRSLGFSESLKPTFTVLL